MDVSSAKWLSELEMEEYLYCSDLKMNPVHEYPLMDSTTTTNAVAAALSLSSESLSSADYLLLPINHSNFQLQTYMEAADHHHDVLPKSASYHKAPVTNNSNIGMTNNKPFAPSTTRRASSSSNCNSTFIMSFGSPNSPPHDIHQHLKYSGGYKEDQRMMNTNNFLEGGEKRGAGATSRNESQAQDHVLAERKRREMLTRRFIALSALLPNLKKMDKATVLEDATKYIKQLQTRMKQLQQETTTTTSNVNKRLIFKLQESSSALISSIKRSKINSGDHDDINNNTYTPAASSDETDSSPNCTFNPEVEVRISERSILVRIYTNKNPSVAMKTLGDMERLHLTISSSSVIPFSTNLLLITITAQMSEECELTAMDVVKRLQSAIRSYI